MLHGGTPDARRRHATPRARVVERVEEQILHFGAVSRA
jgi:hypothetical protein